LNADGSGLIRSDFDAERGLVDCLIVDSHGSGKQSTVDAVAAAGSLKLDGTRTK
jgi:hypothetical protein